MSGQDGRSRPIAGGGIVYEDRSDLPPGYVLIANTGHLSVMDRDGAECASLLYKRDRWVWRSGGSHGIAPSPPCAWVKILANMP